jgi:bla regulator protein BlaR1
MSGVTGSDLGKRVERIMAGAPARKLSHRAKLALYAGSLAAIAIPVVIGVMSAPVIQAQTQDPTAPLPSFEVASIKPSKPESRGGMVRLLPGGGITVTNTPLKVLIQVAYHIQDYQLSGASGWMDSEACDINAKPAHHADNGETRLMMRSLLTDRFHLVIHRETEELPVYALTTAKNGPKLHEANGPASDDDGGFRWAVGHVYGKRVPVADIAEVLSGVLERPVLDRTGVAGLFDMKLQWTPENYKPGPVNPNRALNEPEPVESIVIDSAQKPSAN